MQRWCWATAGANQTISLPPEWNGLQNYRVASPLSLYDEYFIVHAEGFKPKHEVKTGFDFAELREVARAVADILGLELSDCK